MSLKDLFANKYGSIHHQSALKPCPFCGSKEVEAISKPESMVDGDSKCRNCLATGPIVIYGWNDRAVPASILEDAETVISFSRSEDSFSSYICASKRIAEYIRGLG